MRGSIRATKILKLLAFICRANKHFAVDIQCTTPMNAPALTTKYTQVDATTGLWLIKRRILRSQANKDVDSDWRTSPLVSEVLANAEVRAVLEREAEAGLLATGPNARKQLVIRQKGTVREWMTGGPAVRPLDCVTSIVECTEFHCVA